jgi:hypothetical protein
LDGYARRFFRDGTVVLGLGCTTQKLSGGFGHYNFHDGFTVAGAGDAAGSGIGIAAAADERRIADAAGELAAGASGGGGGEEFSVGIESYCADRALLVTAMVGCGVFVLAAMLPGFALGVADEVGGVA